jgi:hypothetical protein
MVTAITTDSFRTIEAVEVGGLILDATRVYVVADDSIPNNGPEATQYILNLDAIPEAGDAYHVDDNPDVIAVSRRVTIEDLRRAEVRVRYQRVNMTFDPLKYVRSTTSMKQVTSDTSPNGAEIVVTHQGTSQRAEVSSLEVEPGIAATVLVETNDPAYVEVQWANYVNTVPWRGGRALGWLCTGARYSALNLITQPQKWLFDVDFSYSLRGWAAEATWQDRGEGRAPTGMSLDTVNSGRVAVLNHPLRDFNVTSLA